MPPVTKNSAKSMKLSVSVLAPKIESRLARIQQDWEDQRAKDSDIRLFAQVSAPPHTFGRRQGTRLNNVSVLDQ